MAKQRGFLKVEGKLDDLSFYKRGEDFLLRQKGGVSKNRIMNDPRFKRTRENVSEFGMVAKAGKLLRDANAVMMTRAYDPSVSNRMMQVFTQVKAADVTSPRGSRQVYVGLGTTQGLVALKGFEFNGRSPLKAVLKAPFIVDKASGKTSIENLIPSEMLVAPPYATHVSFKSALLDVNFETAESDISYSAVVNLPLDSTISSPALTPSTVPTGSGTKMYLLLIEFYQEMNGVQYVLSNGDFNALSIVEVD